MKKILYMLLLLVLMPTQLTQAAKIKDYFISEPGNLFCTLSQGTRAGMIATTEAQQGNKADNRLGGTARISILEDDYMAVETSSSKTIELKILTQGAKDTVIAVIETVKLPVTDSRITFYNSRWQALKTQKYFKQIPTVKSFILPGIKGKKIKELLDDLHFSTIELKFSGPQHEYIVATQQLKNFYGMEDYKKFGQYLKNSITYAIEGTKIKILTP